MRQTKSNAMDSVKPTRFDIGPDFCLYLDFALHPTVSFFVPSILWITVAISHDSNKRYRNDCVDRNSFCTSRWHKNRHSPLSCSNNHCFFLLVLLAPMLLIPIGKGRRAGIDISLPLRRCQFKLSTNLGMYARIIRVRTCRRQPTVPLLYPVLPSTPQCCCDSGDDRAWSYQECSKTLTHMRQNQI